VRPGKRKRVGVDHNLRGVDFVVAEIGLNEIRRPALRRRRAISWKYQNDLMRATPSPRRRIDVRFEDFVLHQEAALARLETYLGFPLARIPVRPETIGRWKTDDGLYDFDFFPREALYS
jgi:hypothetical protein